jgi:hypothetical protein
MNNVRGSRGFAQVPDGQLLPFSGNVITQLIKEAVTFDKLPVTTAILTDLRKAFSDALDATEDGGRLETVTKDAARDALVSALIKDLLYVELVADGNLSVFLSSGFDAVSTNRTQVPLATPQIVAVENNQSGVLKLRVKGDANRRSLLGRIKPVNGSEFGPSISFPSSRDILFKGVTAGITYVMQLCGVGGSTGQSDWTEPVTKMAN